MTMSSGMSSTSSRVLTLRIEEELLARLHEHAARRGRTVQDYVTRVLAREDFDERFRSAVERTARLSPPAGAPRAGGPRPGGAEDRSPARPDRPPRS